jgi:hypothetical protein
MIIATPAKVISHDHKAEGFARKMIIASPSNSNNPANEIIQLPNGPSIG